MNLHFAEFQGSTRACCPFRLSIIGKILPPALSPAPAGLSLAPGVPSSVARKAPPSWRAGLADQYLSTFLQQSKSGEREMVPDSPNWDILVCQFGRVAEMPHLSSLRTPAPAPAGLFFERLT